MSKYYQKVRNPLTYCLEASLDGGFEGALPLPPNVWVQKREKEVYVYILLSAPWFENITTVLLALQRPLHQSHLAKLEAVV